MNGKDYISETIIKVEGLFPSLKSLDELNGDPVLDGLIKACEDLKNLVKKPTLRTRDGATMAFPVYEAVQNLEESWEESQGGKEVEELKERLEALVDAVQALGGALKDKTVILT